MEKEFLYFDPQWIEEAVFAALRDGAEAAIFHNERNRLYEVSATEARERQFRELYYSWFRRLKLADVIEQALSEQPALFSRADSCIVQRAIAKQQEGAELFVRADPELSDREKRTVRLLLRTESITKRSELLNFLRHELYHVVDMLDPNFGYEPALPSVAGGPTHDALLRERYKAFWDTFIDGRMVRRGWLPESTRGERLCSFALVFPMFGEATKRIFELYFDKESHTHAEFVGFASNPRAVTGNAANSPQPGSRCPLCGFPTHAFEPKPELLPQEVVAQIRADFPRWQSLDGLCIQCADLYRAQQLSAAAASALPGAIRPASTV